jgi:hypothetical protein
MILLYTYRFSQKTKNTQGPVCDIKKILKALKNSMLYEIKLSKVVFMD